MHGSGLGPVAYMRQFSLESACSKHHIPGTCFGVYILSYSINQANRKDILSCAPAAPNHSCNLIAVHKHASLFFSSLSLIHGSLLTLGHRSGICTRNAGRHGHGHGGQDGAGAFRGEHSSGNLGLRPVGVPECGHEAGKCCFCFHVLPSIFFLVLQCRVKPIVRFLGWWLFPRMRFGLHFAFLLLVLCRIRLVCLACFQRGGYCDALAWY